MHVVSQRARVLRVRRTDSPLAISVIDVLPFSRNRVGIPLHRFSKLNSPTHQYLYLRLKRQLAMPPARLKARMESLFSFPVGLFHPLQHPGLARQLVASGARGARSRPTARNLLGVDSNSLDSWP